MKILMRAVCLLMASASFCTLSGCVAPTPMAFLGAPFMLGGVIRGIHSGTGWLLDKDNLKIENKVVREDEGSPSNYVGDFHISVLHKENSFATTAKDVPCDRNGIPTEDALERLNEAIDEIKSEIRMLQPKKSRTKIAKESPPSTEEIAQLGTDEEEQPIATANR